MMKLQYIVRKYASEVVLQKDEHCPLGISLTGSQKEGGRPIIRNIKHGSVAQKSHCLSEGDVILSVNGFDTRGMSKKEVKLFFKDAAHPQISMRVEYVTREACFGYCRIYRPHRMSLTLRKVNGTFGFTLRKNSRFMEYPVISSIKHGGPADREGIVMDGDKLLEVDGHSLSWIPLEDIVHLLQNKEEASFLIEYNVGIVDFSEEEETHLEITCPDANLGMTVVRDDILRMFISFIQQGSLAQRCGVLHVGDEILTINDADVKAMSSAKADELFRSFRKGSGKLTFIPKGERLETSVCKSISNTERSSPTYSSSLPNPPNSWNSSFYEPIPEDDFFKTIEDCKTHNDFQLKSMTILKDIQIIADSIQFNVWNETSSLIKDESFSKSVSVNNNDIYQRDNNSETVGLEVQVNRLMKLIRHLLIHVIKNSAQLNHDFRNGPEARKSDRIPDTDISDKFKSEFIDALNEFSNKRLVSKNSTNKLIETIHEINKNCKLCVREFYTASFAVRKVHLLLSLNNTTQQEYSTIRHVLKRLCQLPFPCSDCTLSKSTESATESQTMPGIENNLILPRTDGVGASASSTDSNIYTRMPASGSPLPTESLVSLDLFQQTVLYNIKRNEHLNSKVTNCETRDKNTTPSSCGDAEQSKSVRYHQDSINSHAYNQTGLGHYPETRDGNTTPSSRGDTERSSSVRYHQNSINSHSYNQAGLRHRPNLDQVDEHGTSSRPHSTLTNHSKASSTLTSLTEAARMRAIPNDDHQSMSSFKPTYTHERHSTPLPQSPVRKPLCQCKSSMGFDVQHEYSHPIAGSSQIPTENSIVKTKPYFQAKHADSHEVSLKAENGRFGFILGYNSLLVEDENRVPIILAIKPKSAAHNCGLLKKGDRILAMNGFGTAGISLGDLESLQRDAFSVDEVVLTVEFDVVDAEDRWGTFTLQLETCLKLGLVMDEPKYPSFVRGVIKGSSSHRSGQLLPGDEILSFSTLREETLNLQSWTTRKTRIHRLTVHREQNSELRKKEVGSRGFDPPFHSLPMVQSGPHFIIKRTSIRTVEGGLKGQNKMILEQEFTLFRDPLKWDFGFLFGENPQTGNAYITDIRPGGPADNSKIIKKYDRIIEVNGVLIDISAENSVMNMFMKTEDQVHLVTRRILHYR